MNELTMALSKDKTYGKLKSAVLELPVTTFVKHRFDIRDKV